MVSTQTIASNDNSLTYYKDRGTINGLTDKTETDFIEAGGVYWLKLLIPKALAQKPSQAPLKSCLKASCCPGPSQDFGRPGA